MASSITKRALPSDLADLHNERWEFVYQQFLSLVTEDLRSEIERIVSCIHGNGEGLRCWINDIAYRGRVMPTSIPRELLMTYLTDPEALPLHDCADCGLSIPVRPNRLYGSEGEPEEEYFPVCPACGGNTGLYCYWSNRHESLPQALVKPR